MFPETCLDKALTSCFYSCLRSRPLCTHSVSTHFSSTESLSDQYPVQVSQNGWWVWLLASWLLLVGGLRRLIASQLKGSVWGLCEGQHSVVESEQHWEWSLENLRWRESRRLTSSPDHEAQMVLDKEDVDVVQKKVKHNRVKMWMERHRGTERRRGRQRQLVKDFEARVN